MTMARASATRRPIPPDSSAGISSAAPRKPTACNFVSTSCRISRSVRSVCSRNGNATFSNTLKSVSIAPFWNSMPIRRRSTYKLAREMVRRFSPATSMVPLSASTCPVISRSSVVFPVPLGPMTAVILPRGIWMSRPANTGRPFTE